MERVKLQVPIDKKVYQQLKAQAKELGFDSAQAYVRFWAKSVVSDSKNRSDAGLAQPSRQALRYLELVLAMAPKEPKSTEEALEYISKQLRNIKLDRYLDTLLKKKHQI